LSGGTGIKISIVRVVGELMAAGGKYLRTLEMYKGIYYNMYVLLM